MGRGRGISPNHAGILAGSSPAWGRVLVELAQSQTFRRRTTPLDPMFQILAPKLRLEVPPDVQLFSQLRNLQDIRAALQTIGTDTAQAMAVEVDKLLEGVFESSKWNATSPGRTWTWAQAFCTEHAFSARSTTYSRASMPCPRRRWRQGR